MPFKKGQSGNPDGRPPSGQAYTEILKTVGNQTEDYQGKKVARKRLLAMYLWELATTRKVTFPDGSTITAPAEEWLDTVWRLIERVDGLPVQHSDITTGGEKINQNVVEIKGVDYRTVVTKLAPGSIPNSDAPGENENPING